MVVETDPGCGDASYTSSLWTVKANGASTHVYGSARTTEYAVPDFWSIGETVEIGWARVGADEAVTFEVTLLSGAITSARVYPAKLYSISISGGKAYVTLPVGGSCFVEVNGVRKNRIALAADEIPTPPDLNDPTVDIYDGSQVVAAGGRTLYFGAQVHDLVNDGTWNDMLFPVESDARIYFERGAVVIGNFDFVTSPTTIADSVLIDGPGNWSGEWITPEVVDALPGGFAVHITYAMIYGVILGVGGMNNVVRGVTIFRYPFHAMSSAVVNEIYNVGCLAPWNDHCDGFKAWASGGTYYIQNCFCWTGDDAIVMESWMQEGVVSGNLLSTAGSHVLNFGYQQEYGDFGWTTTVRDNYVAACNDYYLDINGTTGGGIVMCWNDALRTSSGLGRFGVTIDGLHVEGATINAILFWLGSQVYPFPDGNAQDGYGAVSGWTIRNVTTEVVPAERSRLRGLSGTNTPSGVAFEGIAIGGVPVNARNHETYVDIDEECFNITFDGRGV